MKNMEDISVGDRVKVENAEGEVTRFFDDCVIVDMDGSAGKMYAPIDDVEVIE